MKSFPNFSNLGRDEISGSGSVKRRIGRGKSQECFRNEMKE